MSSPANEYTNEKKRKKTIEEENVNLKKKKIEFEDDEEFEKYVFSNFKNVDENYNNKEQYVLSEITKAFFNDNRKYKSIEDMANEIKYQAIKNIKKNLDIICNNECTSPFFVERFRVKYINEQNVLNIKTAQNYFKEFVVLYKNNNFNDFSLEINTNIEEGGASEKNNIQYDDDIDSADNQKSNDNTKAKLDNSNNNDNNIEKNKNNSILNEENMYISNIWKEKIKCKIDNINDNNILTKILNYIGGTSIHVDHIPMHLNKFHILNTLSHLKYNVMNINIWDVYNTKDTRGQTFFRRANIYFNNKTSASNVLNTIRENSYAINIHQWYMNNVRRNIYNNIDFKICPPICSHIERIKKDYNNAKALVRKLDYSCGINMDLLNKMNDDTYLNAPVNKRRKVDDKENGETKEDISKNISDINTLNDNNIVNNTNDHNDDRNDFDNENIPESPIISMIENNEEQNYDVKKKLDILILYLRFVHSFCYYSAKKFNTYDELLRECGYFYLRVNIGEKKLHKNFIPIFYENCNIEKDNTYLDNAIINAIYTEQNTLLNEDIKNNISINKEHNNIENKNSFVIHNETNNHNENSNYELKYSNHMLLYKLLLNNKKKEIFSVQDEEEMKISEFQLKWLVHFDNEIKNAINNKYYENINIEKTEEFLDILKKDYALTTSDNKQSDIRCSKCKKLFHHINDLPNHIFLKHNQFKMKLITETEVQIMKKKFYETPHSFHFLFMMEKKYNYMFKNYNYKHSIFKRNKSFINHNLHILNNTNKNEYKDFDDPQQNVLQNVKHTSTTKSKDFYDDT
ncbi:conserved Plasmodium protein, unknown function [Plasmodium sp. gorilla clade G2]|uniref:conserved Plasmodium protein, unknown function n=1 Tax=Plasmodium sp. gorilla clade G2 TaxID=880535 RepID=UPI000D227DE9|nr:conserved Plasmodium protein, unknown function [Plasmodium sp. gorilla clade G2]SOV19868.1 conserved Plasmodium protein, unknown function [Plasmodium sp. gorilla clade G2]